jgi:tetratricopeptide (TPR) repeat protein
MDGRMGAKAIFGRFQPWGRRQTSHGAEGEGYLGAGNYAEAERYLSLAVADAEEYRVATAIQIRLRLQLAEAQRKLGKLEQAKETLSAAIVCTAREGNTTAYVECLDALAELFDATGDFSEVPRLLEEAGRLEAAQPHPDLRKVARRARRLGTVRHLLGQDASSLLERATKLHEQAFGEEHLETADSLTELGVIYRGQGKHAEAQRCLRRAVIIHERACGPDSKEAVEDHQHLAGSLEDSGNLDAAAAQYERLLTQIQRVVGCNLDELAEMQCRIAAAYTRWRNYSRARELLGEAIGTFARTKGPRMAGALETLAHVEELSGHLRSAISELSRAAAIWESRSDEYTTELERNMRKRAELHTFLNETADAQWLRDRAAELVSQPPLPSDAASTNGKAVTSHS